MRLPAGLLKGVALSFHSSTTIEEAQRVYSTYKIEIELSNGYQVAGTPARLETLTKHVERFGFLYLPIWTDLQEGTELTMRLRSADRYAPFFPRPVMIDFQAWCEPFDGGQRIFSEQAQVSR